LNENNAPQPSLRAQLVSCDTRAWAAVLFVWTPFLRRFLFTSAARPLHVPVHVHALSDVCRYKTLVCCRNWPRPSREFVLKRL
jgi:hypothetical protein